MPLPARFIYLGFRKKFMDPNYPNWDQIQSIVASIDSWAIVCYVEGLVSRIDGRNSRSLGSPSIYWARRKCRKCLLLYHSSHLRSFKTSVIFLLSVSSSACILPELAYLSSFSSVFPSSPRVLRYSSTSEDLTEKVCLVIVLLLATLQWF